MARRVSRRKMPDRDIHQVKEEQKTDSGIFNERTMLYLSKFYNKGVIDKISYPIAKGKESDVYLGDAGESRFVGDAKYVCMKFFRIETSSFYKMRDYIEGDRRFGHVKRDKRSIILIWCKKEFGNLRMASNAGVRGPKPYMYNGSILALEFIGSDDGKPAPKLREVTLDDPEGMLDDIIENMKKLHAAGLVHSDMSEYNILVKDSLPWFIDMGQAVILKHPSALEFLERDVRNICSYFKASYGIDTDHSKMMDRIIGQRKAR